MTPIPPNESISALRGAEQGRLGFVVGSGPSVLQIDFERLAAYPIVVVNSAILLAPFACYWCSADPRSTFRASFEKLVVNGEHKPTVCVIYETNYLTGIDLRYPLLADRTFFFQRQNGDGGSFRRSDDRLFNGTSSAHFAAHLAAILGCDPIVILGCDCGFDANGKRYFFDYPPYSDPYRPDDPWKDDPNLLPLNSKLLSQAFVWSWSQAKIEAEKSGVNLINASAGNLGELKLIDRPAIKKLDLDTILKTYG